MDLKKIFSAIGGIAEVMSKFSEKNTYDLDSDWVCDNCGASLNDQSGFTAGDVWFCTECGYANDVTSDNIINDEVDDDGREIIKIKDPIDEAIDYSDL